MLTGGVTNASKKQNSCCDLNSWTRVSRFFQGTCDAPDVMEWKVPGKCARVKGDDQQQNGIKNASEG